MTMYPNIQKMYIYCIMFADVYSIIIKGSLVEKLPSYGDLKMQ